ncbi:MAG: chemotaxis protein CheW [Myxococcus sp.]|nr:chemotaxis protein CheW [Myxococcus sp.]
MSEGPRGHLVFACAGSLYAVPAERASEVVNLPALTRVPGAAPHLLGVFAHRGEVLPVIDLTRLIGKPVEERFKRVVVVRVARGAMAFTATRVIGVNPIPGALPRLGETGALAFMSGPATVPAGECAAIDPEGLLEYLSRGR